MHISHFRNAFNNELTRNNDLRSVAADIAEVPGRVMINAAGEAFVDVDFAVNFTTLPFFKCGFEIPENENTIPGQMPTGRAFVSEWKMRERLPFSVFYTGAKICVVTTGPYYQKMIMNFSFSGTALTNPGVL